MKYTADRRHRLVKRCQAVILRRRIAVQGLDEMSQHQPVDLRMARDFTDALGFAKNSEEGALSEGPRGITRTSACRASSVNFASAPV